MVPVKLLLFTACIAWCLAGAKAQRIALIGGGVAGSAAAYYARQALGEQAEIEVFERDQLGGRAREVEYDGVTLELGASIVWHKNYLVRDLAQAAGLEREPPPADGLLALYDGRQLVFRESPWRLLTLFRLLLRYWFSWFSFRPAPAAAFVKFQGIYTLLDKGSTFERPDKLLQAVGLYDLTQASMFEWLREAYGTSADTLGQELIAGVNRVNYNQGNQQLNALAGLVSMLPATEPSLFRIKGGNSQLASRALELVNATVHRPAAVASVERLPDGRFRLQVQQQCSAGSGQSAGVREEAVGGMQGGAGTYDAVIVATPLESSGLGFPGLDLPVIPARKYQQTVTTVIKGAVRPSYFGLSNMDYGAVMVTDEASVPWSSLSLVGRTVSDNTTLWKMFSREPLPHAWASMMFEQGFEVVATKVWSTPGAYPSFDPPEDFAPFVLAPGLYYTAALENAVSALEVAAIEGRMAALLAAKHLKGRPVAAMQLNPGAAVQDQQRQQVEKASGDVLSQAGQAAAEQEGAATAA